MPVRAYNSNGLWLGPPAATADEAIVLRDEGGFAGLKLRLGRDRPADDVAAIETIRRAVGDDMHLMADFNQGLDMSEALRRCPMIDDLGLDLDRGADPVRKPRGLRRSSQRNSRRRSRSARISTGRATWSRRSP